MPCFKLDRSNTRDTNLFTKTVERINDIPYHLCRLYILQFCEIKSNNEKICKGERDLTSSSSVWHTEQLALCSGNITKYSIIMLVVDDFGFSVQWQQFSGIPFGAAVVEWLSSWLAEQEDRGSIPGLAIWIFRDWLSPASKSRYGWKIAKSTLILKTTNQPIEYTFLFTPAPHTKRTEAL